MRKKKESEGTEGGSWVVRQDKEKERKKHLGEGEVPRRSQSKVKSQRGRERWGTREKTRRRRTRRVNLQKGAQINV